jgi:hypothetical protein
MGYVYTVQSAWAAMTDVVPIWQLYYLMFEDTGCDCELVTSETRLGSFFYMRKVSAFT